MPDNPILDTPPHNEDAEEAVLSTMIREHDSISDCVQIVNENDFYIPENKVLFHAIAEMNDEGLPIDLVTLTEKLRKSDLLEKAGGLGRVARVAGASARLRHASYYAKIVREKSNMRHLIHTCRTIANRAFEDSEAFETILDDAEKRIMEISQRGERGGLEIIETIIGDTLARVEWLCQQNKAITGVPSGFIDLDRITSGWQNSDFIIIAARPAMGKTALCLNMASNAAVGRPEQGEKGVPVAIFSLEMSKEQLAQRMISAYAQVDQQYLRTGTLPLDDWPQLIAAVAPLSSAPIYIDDTPGITIRELRAKARRLKTEVKNLGLIIIDYLQLMGAGGKSENRQQEVSQISRALKSLARELNVPIIALSQLSRSVETTHDKRPALSHLRESGSLEQDADLVLFIYREEYYFPEETERAGIAELIIAKHRNGSTGTVDLSFQKEFTKFGNLAPFDAPNDGY